jgi:hypothetical protein
MRAVMGKKFNKDRVKVGRNDACPCGSKKKFKKCHGETSHFLSVPLPRLNVPASTGKQSGAFSKNYKEIGARQYQSLFEYENTRCRELSGIYSDEIKLVQDLEQLFCRAVSILGEIPPNDNLDRSLRDLGCDAFDALYTIKQLILGNYHPMVLPLLRRAYETVCLIHYFQLEPLAVNKWEKGHQFNNVEIRKFLDTHPMGEKGEELKSLYSFYSKGTHVNRDYIPNRHLGDGNQFTLGSISKPSLFVTTDYMQQLVGLWFWLIGTITYYYRDIFWSHDAGYGKDYLAIADRAKAAIQSLFEAKERIRMAEIADMENQEK